MDDFSKIVIKLSFEELGEGDQRYSWPNAFRGGMNRFLKFKSLVFSGINWVKDSKDYLTDWKDYLIAFGIKKNHELSLLTTQIDGKNPMGNDMKFIAKLWPYDRGKEVLIENKELSDYGSNCLEKINDVFGIKVQTDSCTLMFDKKTLVFDPRGIFGQGGIDCVWRQVLCGQQ